MTIKDRVITLLDYGFSFETISINSPYWNKGERIPSKKLQELVGLDYTPQWECNEKVKKLSPEKQDMYHYIANAKSKGMTNQAIADVLDVPYHTVRFAFRDYISRKVNHVRGE